MFGVVETGLTEQCVCEQVVRSQCMNAHSRHWGPQNLDAWHFQMSASCQVENITRDLICASLIINMGEFIFSFWSIYICSLVNHTIVVFLFFFLLGDKVLLRSSILELIRYPGLTLNLFLPDCRNDRYEPPCPALTLFSCWIIFSH